MFLSLKHKEMRVYQTARELGKEVYRFISILPKEERFNMVDQIRRASLSVKLNIGEGASRRSAIERKRYYEIARGSVSEMDGIIESAVDVGYCKIGDWPQLGELINKAYAQLSKLMDNP